MTVLDRTRAPIWRSTTEAQWQALIIRWLNRGGWMYYHTFDARRSPRGFPDLVMIRHGRLIVAELKREGGWVARPQALWLAAFQRCGIETYVWRPHDEESVREILLGEMRREHQDASATVACGEPAGGIECEARTDR